MFGTHALPLFALATLVVNATPGVDMLLTLTKTLQLGRRGGLVAAAGICAGCIVHTLAAAFGLAALLAASGSAFAVVKTLGALYLAWLAIGLWRAAWRGDAAPATGAQPLGEGASRRPGTLGATFREGLLTNVLNPKIAIFFLALLPQFIDPDAPAKTAAFLFLGAWFIAQSFAFLAAFVALVASLRRVEVSRRARRAFQAAGGTLFAGLAARLAFAEAR